MQFNQRFLDIILGFVLGILFCTSKYFVNDNYTKIIAIVILCLIILNEKDFVIDSLIIFILLFAIFHIVFY